MKIFWKFVARLAFCLVVFSAGKAAADDLVIEKGGFPWTIFVEPNAPDSVRTAAKDLQTYVAGVSGVEMPVVSTLGPDQEWVIYLGDTDFARAKGISTDKLPPDGFRILTGDTWVVIAGKDYSGDPLHGTENPYRLHETYNNRLKISAFGDAGTQQGVYHFLRTFCGVRWYMPGPLGEVVPSMPQILITPTDMEKAPVFEYRYPYFCFFSSSDNDSLWYRRAGFGAPFPVSINHSFQLFLKYKETHPEYFALIDGQRDFTTLSSLIGPGNLNLSDPGLIQQAITDINEYFDNNPKERFFSLVPPDGMKRISEDPVSQAQIDESRGPGGRFSNYVWGFINKVAKGVYEKHPDKLISCIAYENYCFPPTNVEKMSPNVAVMVCKPLRRAMPDPVVEASIWKRIDDWSEKVGTIYCWEYYCDILFNAGWRGYPVFYPPKNIQKDLQFLKGKVKGEMIEAETWTEDQYSNPSKIVINDPGLNHLRLYVTSQLLWDPDQDLAPMLEEYYHLFYGPAWLEMKEFWETAEAAWMEKAAPEPGAVYSKETVDILLGCLSRASEKTVAGTPYRSRVELIQGEFKPAAEKVSRLDGLRETETEIQMADDREKIDGDLTRAYWSQIPLLSLIDSSYSTGTPATHLRLSWTEKALNVAVTCFEPDMQALKARVTKENQKKESAIWADDSVELFLQPEGEACYQIIVNPNGVLYSAKMDSRDDVNKGKEWESGATVAVKKGKSSWIIEMSIPWKSLGIENGAVGLQLRSNFYRSRFAGGELQQYSWAPLVKGQFFAPEEFGLMTLSAKQGE